MGVEHSAYLKSWVFIGLSFSALISAVQVFSGRISSFDIFLNVPLR